ncbi:hypothetical protein NP313_18075, partial [Salmonella enterica]|uniref:hypothetical protein n=2 Tax=Enterobacteriaceae TaxID=543 RepID=UPI001BAF71A1
TKFDANVRSYAPVRARLVREPYRRIRKTSGYAGGYLFISIRTVIKILSKKFIKTPSILTAIVIHPLPRSS